MGDRCKAVENRGWCRIGLASTQVPWAILVYKGDLGVLASNSLLTVFG